MAPRARTVTCAGPSCRQRFTPKRSTAKYHSPACRDAARRARNSAAAGRTKKASPTSAKPATTEAPKRADSKQTGTSAADQHELVVALRQELETAQVLSTFEGQLAVELAKRLVQPDSNASALAEKVRAARSAALEQSGSKPAAAGEQPAEPDDDEVTRARKQREEARKAAGLA